MRHWLAHFWLLTLHCTINALSDMFCLLSLFFLVVLGRCSHIQHTGTKVPLGCMGSIVAKCTAVTAVLRWGPTLTACTSNLPGEWVFATIQQFVLQGRQCTSRTSMQNIAEIFVVRRRSTNECMHCWIFTYVQQMHACIHACMSIWMPSDYAAYRSCSAKLASFAVSM